MEATCTPKGRNLKLRKLAAASAGTMLALSAFSAPQIANAETTDDQAESGAENSDTGAEGDAAPGEGDDTAAGDDDTAGDEQGEISFESSQGSKITPGETLVLSPDDADEGVFVETINADPATADAWAAETNEETGEVTITAPAAPEEQEEGVDVEYGEHVFTLVTNSGYEYELTLNFAAEEQEEEPEEPSSAADIREDLRNLSSNLSSGQLSSNLSSS